MLLEGFSLFQIFQVGWLSGGSQANRLEIQDKPPECTCDQGSPSISWINWWFKIESFRNALGSFRDITSDPAMGRCNVEKKGKPSKKKGMEKILLESLQILEQGSFKGFIGWMCKGCFSTARSILFRGSPDCENSLFINQRIGKGLLHVCSWCFKNDFNRHGSW